MSTLPPERQVADAVASVPGFAAPQRLQFAFCVTAWEALTGARPFSGATIEELRRAVEAGVAPDVELPGAVRDVLMRGLAADPARRWPDLDALLAAFAHATRPKSRAAFASGRCAGNDGVVHKTRLAPAF